MIRYNTILLSGLFSVVLASTALAQQMGGQSSPFGAQPRPPMPMGAPGSGAANPMSGAPGASTPQTPHIEGELAFLKAEIKITDAQSKKWDAFADSAREAIKAMQAITAQQPPPGSAHTVLDSMTMREKYLKARSESLAAMIDKFKPLYDSMNDEQKASADQLVPMHLAMAL